MSTFLNAGIKEDVCIGFFCAPIDLVSERRTGKFNAHTWIGILIRNDGPGGREAGVNGPGRSLLIYDCDANRGKCRFLDDKGELRRAVDVMRKHQRDFRREAEKVLGTKGKPNLIRRVYMQWPEPLVANQNLCVPLSWGFLKGFMQEPSRPLEEKDKRVWKWACFEKR
jgi:hypothetical protein